MRKLKKLLAIVLTAALLLGMTAVTASAAGAFADTEKHWAESSIERWAGHNIVQGGDNGLFDPNKKMTRAEFAVVLSQLLKLEDMGNASFTDVPKTAWYAKPMLTLANAGILAGFEDGTAAPYALISREQAFALLARALHIPDSTSTQKQPGVAFWAQGAINALRERGILKGTEDDNGVVQLAPKQEIDKASMMSLLDRTVTTYIDTPGTYENTTDNGVVLVVTDGNVSVTGTAAAVVVADAADGASVTLSGAAVTEGVTVSAPDVNLALSSSTVAGGVTVTEDASNANVQVYSGSTVDTVTTAANNVSVSGSGKVESVEVTGGDKVNVSTSGTEVKVDEAATGSTVTAGGATVAPGQSTTTSGSSGGSSGGSTPVTPPAPTTYTISFALDGGTGTVPAAQTVNAGEDVTVTMPAAPTKTGYTFGGWSDGTNTHNADATVALTAVSANVTYTAVWTATSYTITYELDSGTNASGNPATYTIETDTITLADPTKAGNIFEGWFTDNTYATEVETIVKGSTGDVTLYAKWHDKIDTEAELNAAIAAAQSGETVTMEDNITVNQRINIEKPITLDGGNFTLSASSSFATTFTNGAGLDIVNSVVRITNGVTVKNLTIDANNLNTRGIRVAGRQNQTDTMTIGPNVTIKNAKVTTPTKDGNNDDIDSGSGGGIANDAPSGCKLMLTLNSVTITNCSSCGDGGAVFFGQTDGTLTIKGDTKITGCHSGDMGGAIMCGSEANIIIENTEPTVGISNNTAASEGPGIYLNANDYGGGYIEVLGGKVGNVHLEDPFPFVGNGAHTPKGVAANNNYIRWLSVLKYTGGTIDRVQGADDNHYIDNPDTGNYHGGPAANVASYSSAPNALTFAATQPYNG